MKFYRISNAYKRSAIQILTTQNFSLSEHIPLDSPMISNNKFIVDSGKKWFDLVGFANSHIHFAISSKFKSILETQNVKGWTCFPIEIDESNDKYYVFQFTSMAGEILNREKLNRYEEKLKFDLNTWDGSGIFTLKGTTIRVCTKDVKEILEKEKITNIEFDEL
ncbi:MAG: hypothetical protein EBQ94_13025 [Flavobacteriales bacterium]|nr:hypothetical protein [Flavobacteriales bacterium]NCA22440.1 hypothetical protein [Crocinitomicaceae bacterium]